MRHELTQARLKELLHYDPETGVFTWKVRSCNRWSEVGRVAGTPDGKGYLMVVIDQVRYKLHRLAFLYMLGRMPLEQVDHRLGDVTDNRWETLREASGMENMQNRAKATSNTSGFTGVTRSPRATTWVARIGAARARQYLGSFDTPEEAYQAYLSAKAQLHTFQPVPRDLCTTM